MRKCMASTCSIASPSGHPTSLDIQQWIPDGLHITTRIHIWKLLQNILGWLCTSSWTPVCLKFLTSGFTPNSCPVLWCTVYVDSTPCGNQHKDTAVGDRFSNMFGVSFYKVHTKTKQCALWWLSLEMSSSLDISLDISQWQLRTFVGKQFCESNTLPNIQQIPETPEHTQQIGLSKWDLYIYIICISYVMIIIIVII